MKKHFPAYTQLPLFLKTALVMLGFILPLKLHAQIITTFAGSGSRAYSGDGGPATVAGLRPGAMAFDSNGNLYIADSSLIRKIDVNGIITKVAGGGTMDFDGVGGGSIGDGGPATAARLGSPNYITIDGSGNLYISDPQYYRVRKVDVNGIITTVAGSRQPFGHTEDGILATEATFNFVTGVAIDKNGNLYIGDVNTHRIRKVDKNGIITTVVGTGVYGYSGDGGPATKATIHFPTDMKMDKNGNLYFVDLTADNINRVRKVDTNGIITTVAGNGTFGFSGDGGPAINASFRNIGSIVVDENANLYITDAVNSRIRKVDANGIIATIAGNGTFGFSGDGGPAINAVFNSPGSLAIDGSGNLYIGDGQNKRVRKISPPTPTDPFALVGVNLLDCQSISPSRKQITITPQYTGRTDQQLVLAITTGLITTQPGPYTLQIPTDQPLITLIAQQGNVVSSYNYRWLDACQNSPQPNRAPTTTGIGAQAAQLGQPYTLGLAAYFADPEGQSLTFQVSTLPAGLNLTGSVISGVPSTTGISSVHVTAVAPGGLSVTTSFELTVSGQTVQPTNFALTGVNLLNCQPISSTELQITLTPQYVGLTGESIVMAITTGLITTQPGPYTLNVLTSQPLITLIAQQGSVVSSYNYRWLDGCNAGLRLASSQEGSGLQALLLGNPVHGSSAEVEIRGVMGQGVRVELVDLQGRRWHEQVISQASSVDRVSVPLGTGRGLLLLQVSSGGQSQTLKVIKGE